MPCLLHYMCFKKKFKLLEEFDQHILNLIIWECLERSCSFDIVNMDFLTSHRVPNNLRRQTI